ncbi:MAG TPA: peptide chain release factor N(5)-glutamine methyltransferase [Candidatus Acidoferrum sp.]|nr:peptide chain release factor N(5)-glutamine methyltransferase [Candidatus Acidoferrum sp.]
MDVRSALKLGLAQLREANVPSFTLATELLLLHALGRDRTWLYAHPEELLTKQQADDFAVLLARRASGVPTQHLTGRQEFWSLEFEVTPDVLIPRPETEHLIEVALDRLAVREIRARRKQTLTGEGLHIADIGTGSGCIAIALAKELPAARIMATDLSSAALSVAMRNAARHNFYGRIRFAEANLLDDSAGPFDAILSNPPYVGRNEQDTLMREVREHEPELALYGGEEGYEFYAPLIFKASCALTPGGLLVLELGHNSLPAVRPLLDPPGWIKVGVTNDLAGIPRVIAAEKS